MQQNKRRIIYGALVLSLIAVIELYLLIYQLEYSLDEIDADRFQGVR